MTFAKQRRRRGTTQKKENCYDKLGVATDATEREIKKKFRKLAIKYHPDKVKKEADKEAAEETFKDLAFCYEILSDKEKRQKYDASGYNEQFDQGGGAQGFHFEGNFEDIFSNFFGKGNNFGFENMFSGSSASGSSGGGFESFSFGGSPFGAGARQKQGQRQRQQQQNMYGQHQTHQAQKKKAKKAKKVYVDLENLMEDSFVTVKNKRGNTVELEIPKGCPEGHKITENGMKFEIYTKTHNDFSRGKLQSALYANVTITLEEALLGFNLEIMTLDNELIQERVERIPTNKQIQIKDKGLPRYSSDSRGHLFVNIDVLVPTLNEKQKENLKGLIESQGEWDYSEAKMYKKKRDERRKRRNKNKKEL